MTIHLSTLPNGLRVVTEKMPHVESVALGIWVGAGTRHERPEENGVAHLLEHMAFKGTRQRSARDIAEAIENVGGHLNAYTGRENTAYLAKVLKEDLPLALDLLSDILNNSAFDEGELARERAVVLQEIGQAEDTPDDIIFDHFQAAAYPGQGIGRPVLGDRAVVGTMPRKTLIDYMRKNYGAGRMVLAAAGNVDHERLVDLAAEHFAGLPAVPEDPGDAARYVGGDWRAERPLEQAHLIFGWPSVPITDSRHFTAVTLATLLGGGMSSRLFQEVREERGLVYSIYSFNSAFLDDGLFGVYAGTGPDEIAELVPVVFEQLAGVGDGVGDAELERAKAQLRASVLMGLESPGARCEQIAQQLLIYGRVLGIDEIKERIEAVDPDGVAAFARQLAGGPLTVAAMGPIGGLEPYDRLSARFA